MDWIFESLMSLIFNLVAMGLNTVSGWVQDTVSFDKSSFVSLFTNGTYVFDDLYKNVILPFAFAIIIYNLLMGLFKGFFSETVVEVEEPGPLLVKSFIAFFVVGIAQSILGLFVDIFSRLLSFAHLDTLTIDFSSFGQKIAETVTNSAQAANGASQEIGGVKTTLGLLLAVIFMLILGWNFLKIIFVLVERYAMYNILIIIAPPALACFNRRTTVDVTKRFGKMFAQSLISLLFSICFMKIYTVGVSHVGNADGNGAMFMNFLIVLAFAKIIQKLDDLLVQLGLLAVRPLPAHFPMPMLLGGGRSVSNIVKGARAGISGSERRAAFAASGGGSVADMVKGAKEAFAGGTHSAPSGNTNLNSASSSRSTSKPNENANIHTASSNNPTAKPFDFQDAKNMIQGSKDLKNEAAENVVRSMMPSGTFMKNGKPVGGLNINGAMETGRMRDGAIPGVNAANENGRPLNDLGSDNPKINESQVGGLGQIGSKLGEKLPQNLMSGAASTAGMLENNSDGIMPRITMLGSGVGPDGRIKTAGMSFSDGEWSDPTGNYALGDDKMNDFAGGSILDSSNIETEGLSDVGAFCDSLDSIAGSDGIVEGYSSDGIPMTFTDNGSGDWAVDVGGASFSSIGSAMDNGALSDDDTINLYNPASKMSMPASVIGASGAADVGNAFNSAAGITYSNGFAPGSDFADMGNYTITRAGNSSFDGNYIGKDGMSHSFTARYVSDLQEKDQGNAIRLKDGNYFNFEHTGTHEAVTHLDANGIPQKR